MVAQVYKAVRQGTTDVAVKTLNVKALSDLLLYQMRKESAILRKVSHDCNIVQYYGACLPSPASLELSDSGAMLVMEYMEVRVATLNLEAFRCFALRCPKALN